MIRSAASIGSCSCVSIFGSLSSTACGSSHCSTIENPVVAEQEPPARLLVGLFGAVVFGALLRVFDLPENDDRAFLALADVAAKFVGLAIGEPQRRNVFRRGKQKVIDAAIRLLADKVARQSG